MTAVLAYVKNWLPAVLEAGRGLPADELQLPLQERTLTQLDMSAIERHFYSIQHEVSLSSWHAAY